MIFVGFSESSEIQVTQCLKEQTPVDAQLDNDPNLDGLLLGLRLQSQDKYREDIGHCDEVHE